MTSRVLILLDTSPLVPTEEGDAGGLARAATELDGAILVCLRVLLQLQALLCDGSGGCKGAGLRWGYRLFDSKGEGVGRTPSELQRIVRREGCCKGSYSRLDVDSLHSFASGLLSVARALSGDRLRRDRDRTAKRWAHSQSSEPPNIAKMFAGHDMSSKALLLRSIMECIHEIEFEGGGDDSAFHKLRQADTGSSSLEPEQRNFLIMCTPCPRGLKVLDWYEKMGDFSESSGSLRQGLEKLSSRLSSQHISPVWLDYPRLVPCAPRLNTDDGDDLSSCLHTLKGCLVPWETLVCGSWVLPGRIVFGDMVSVPVREAPPTKAVVLQTPWGQQGDIMATPFLCGQSVESLQQVSLRGCIPAIEVDPSWFGTEHPTVVLTALDGSEGSSGWRMLLSTLASRECAAIVELMNEESNDGDSKVECMGIIFPLTETCAVLRGLDRSAGHQHVSSSFSSLVFSSTGSSLGAPVKSLVQSQIDSVPVCAVAGPSLGSSFGSSTSVTLRGLGIRLSGKGSASLEVPESAHDGTDFGQYLTRSSTIGSASSLDAGDRDFSSCDLGGGSSRPSSQASNTVDEQSILFPPACPSQSNLLTFATAGAISEAPAPISRSLPLPFFMDSAYAGMPAFTDMGPEAFAAFAGIEDERVRLPELDAVRAELDAKAAAVMAASAAAAATCGEEAADLICGANVVPSVINKATIGVDIADEKGGISESNLILGYNECVNCGKPSATEWSVELIREAVELQGPSDVAAALEASVLLKPKDLTARYQALAGSAGKDLRARKVREYQVQALLRLRLCTLKRLCDPLPNKERKPLLKVLESLSFFMDAHGATPSSSEVSFSDFMERCIAHHFAGQLPLTVRQLYASFERPLPASLSLKTEQEHEELRKDGSLLAPEPQMLQAETGTNMESGILNPRAPVSEAPKLKTARTLTPPPTYGQAPASRFPGQRSKPPQLFRSATLPTRLAISAPGGKRPLDACLNRQLSAPISNEGTATSASKEIKRGRKSGPRTPPILGAKKKRLVVDESPP